MQNQMNVPDNSGHSKITWDPENNDEVEVARATFRALKEKGYQAFAVGRFGRQGERITEFDPEVGEILWVPHLKGG